MPFKEKSYDVIVVGAGFSGPIVASKIAKEGVNPRTGEPLKIALIEAGPYYKGKPQPGYGIPSRRQMFTQINQDMFQGERSHRPMFPGSVHPFTYMGVGGGSNMWGRKGNPPHEHDYEWWRRETGVDWTKENMKSAIEELLKAFNSRTMRDELLGEYHFRFRDAVQSMGYKIGGKMMFHSKNCMMCPNHNEGQYTCRYDAIASTLLTHIPTAEEHGVEIVPDTVVERVILEKRGAQWTATGVWHRGYGDTGAAQKVEAQKVILTGFLGTVLLLYRSGYGPRDLLGDGVLVENPNVGSHMDGHLHAQIFGAVTAHFEDMIVGEPGDNGFGFYFMDDTDNQGSERLWIVSGVDTKGVSFMGAQTYALDGRAPEYGHKHKEWMRKKMWRYNGRFLTAYSHWSAPKARLLPDGSWDFNAKHPAIQKRMKERDELLRTLYQKMGATDIRVSGQTGTRPFMGIVGGCRAGVDRKNSVVNPDFESHDIANLFVADAMAIPRIYSLWGGGTAAATTSTFAAQRIIANHFTTTGFR